MLYCTPPVGCEVKVIRIIHQTLSYVGVEHGEQHKIIYSKLIFNYQVCPITQQECVELFRARQTKIIDCIHHALLKMKTSVAAAIKNSHCRRRSITPSHTKHSLLACATKVHKFITYIASVSFSWHVCTSRS